MGKVKHLSFEELAGNLADILNNVRAEHTSVVVEYASGVNVLIKPYSPTRRSTRKAQSKGAAPDAEASTALPPPNPKVDTENISSVGAVYDLDPDSITPG